MQRLTSATKLPAGASGASGREALAACAHAVVDSLPPVVWFLRCHMRAHRGGLSLSQFRTLVKVNQQPDANLCGIAEHVGVSRPAMSRMVTTLVKKGLLARRSGGADRRCQALAITPRGRAVLHAAWSAAEAHMETRLAALDGEQRAILEQAMSILRGIFGSLGLPEKDTRGSHPGVGTTADAVCSSTKR